MKLALPAAAVVTALVGTGIAIAGSQSAEAGEGLQLTMAQGGSASQQELRERLLKAIRADKESDSKLVEQPGGAEGSSQEASTSPSTSPSEGSGSSTADSGSAKPSARIIGGQETTISTAPWMAQLHFWDDQGGYFCGGAVISPTKIATAAHCVKDIKWYSNGVVVLGTDQLPTENADGSLDLHGGRIHEVKRQWNHPGFSWYTLDNDVAILTLTTPTTVPTLPLAQPTDSALYQAGLDGKVYGWGRTSSTNPDSASQTLKVADADIVSDASCQAAYPEATDTAAKFVAGNMLCAGAPPTGDDATTETTCNGDSGGPLVVGGKLVGVVSWGDVDCSAQGKYGVYAKVSTYSATLQARADDANWNRDHTADLLARRTSDNTLFGWTSKYASGKWTVARTHNVGNFAGKNLAVQTDLNRDDVQDVLYRQTNGDVYWKYSSATPKLIARGWSAHKQILAPGDVTGDELPDMVTVDSAGTMRVYPGKGTGAFAAPVTVGSGYGSFTMMRGHGDFTNDGKADMFARYADGRTFLYKGTGVAARPWAAPVLVANFSAMNAIATVGDVNSDGHADVLTRDKYGKLWLYPGNGRGGFGTRVDFGTGWQAYNLFG
ncbi:trypsin-like serine protease [Streptomyces coeruleoprunus]|uniref:Trypsin-like serine protease n=1 Tax=Streptomyces coeruleoprunus TaxID=285563 RepID=A0ABV9XNN8_9ACTN